MLLTSIVENDHILTLLKLMVQGVWYFIAYLVRYHD